jgi:hypothetical protein
MKLARIGAPTSLGAFAPGQEQAPRALREAGAAAGFDDFGDLPLRRCRRTPATGSACRSRRPARRSRRWWRATASPA